jgi:hypothetical protein
MRQAKEDRVVELYKAPLCCTRWSRVVHYIPLLTYCSNALSLISSGAPQTKEHRVAEAMIEATLWLS